MNELNTSWHNYPSIYSVGHRYLTELLFDDVLVEEKVDGSQFSFGLFPEPGPLGEKLRCRSKGAEINITAPPGMFQQAVDTVKELEPLLKEGWTYRCEYLQKPKHNSLAYDRVPKKNLILFDVSTGEESYLDPIEKELEAYRLGLERVPQMLYGKITDPQSFRELLDNVSILGGQKIEGVVIKNYNRFGLDKKVLMGKFVSEHFKEVHGGEWKKNNPTRSDIVEDLTTQYKSSARWLKAIQHLRDRNELEQSPRDIGKLILEAKADIQRECAEEIAQKLLEWAMPKILRGSVSGLPEFYKEKLLEMQFDQ